MVLNYGLFPQAREYGQFKFHDPRYERGICMTLAKMSERSILFIMYWLKSPSEGHHYGRGDEIL